MGQLALNGLGFKYLWPEYPAWNMMAVPFWVSIACMFILIFTREFLDTAKYVPIFRKLTLGLIGLHVTTLVLIAISINLARNLMMVWRISNLCHGFDCWAD